MNISPVNDTHLDAVSLIDMQDEDSISQLAADILSAVHGELKVDFSVSLDLPKIAEVLKTQAIATGENSQILWALAAIESDPTKVVDKLCERVADGLEGLGMGEVVALHQLHEKSPELEKPLLESFITLAEAQDLFFEDFGTLALYCLQKDHLEEFDRVMTLLEGLLPKITSYEFNELASSFLEPLLNIAMVSSLTEIVRPLNELNADGAARLGAFMLSLEKEIKLVEPEAYFMARLLQGEEVESIARSCSNPVYQAMVYDAAAFTVALCDPKRAEELLSCSIELAGEGVHTLSYRDFNYSASVDGVPVEVIQLAIAFGYALQDLDRGVQLASERIAGISDFDDLEPVASLGALMIALALYQDKRAEALIVVDALLAKAKELDVEDVGYVALLLTAFFPERKEELSYFADEVLLMPELSLSVKQGDLVQALGELSRGGLVDLGDAEVLTIAASLLAALS